MTATKPVVGYAGMTHLGLNSAVASAELGFDMVCFDPDESRIAPLRKGELPVVEPELPELLAKNRDRIAFTAAILSSVAEVLMRLPELLLIQLGGGGSGNGR